MAWMLRVLSCFFKSRTMFPLGNTQTAARPPEMPRSGKDLIWFVRSYCLCALIRDLQNLESSRKGTVLFFSLVRKEPKVHQRSADLWTPGTVQIAGRYVVFTEMTGVHQVTGYVRTAISHGIDGNDLNRYELQALHKRICGFVRTPSGFFGKQ